jgi:hypothetical protein
MFRTKNTRIEISKFYINDHTLERFKDRKTKEINFQLPKEIQIAVMPQRSKEFKNVEINKLRAVIPIKNDLFIVGNIYQKVVDSDTEDTNNGLIFKALTILNKKQIRYSSNFARGNYLSKGFLSNRPKIIIEDMFFDDTYKDFLDDIEWDETDVQYL